MASKVIIAACAVALFVQMGTAQLGCGYNAGLGLGLAGNILGLTGNGLGQAGNGLRLANNGLAGCNNAAYVGSGGGLGVTSYSPIAPAGVSVRSENAIEGPLELCGDLPVLSAAAFEGQVLTAGQSAVEYSCGNGNVGITSEYGNGGAGVTAGSAASLGYAGAGVARAPIGYGGLSLAGAGLSGSLNGGTCGV